MNRFGRRIPTVFALGLLFILLRPLLVDDAIPVQGDAVKALETYRGYILLGRFLQKGQLPQWTTLVAKGYPFMAEGSIGTIYPINLLFFRYLSSETAYRLVLASTLMTALACMYFLLRSQGVSRSAAHVGAMLFAGGGFVRAHLSDLPLLQGMALLPLAWLLLERSYRIVRPAALLPAAAALAAVWLAGSPAAHAASSGLVIMVLFYHAAVPPPPRLVLGGRLRDVPLRRRLLTEAGTCCLVFGIAFLLAAPALLSRMEFLDWAGGGYPTSDRGARLASIVHRLGEVLFPDAFASRIVDASPPMRAWAIGGGELFPGVVSLIFAGVALLRGWRGPRGIGLPVLMALSGAVPAMMDLVGTGMHAHPPGVIPYREADVTSGALFILLGFSSLAAHGLDAARHELESRPQTLRMPLSTVLPTLALLATLLELGFPTGNKVSWVSASRVLDAPPAIADMPGLGALFYLPVDALEDESASRSARRGTLDRRTGTPSDGDPREVIARLRRTASPILGSLHEVAGIGPAPGPDHPVFGRMLFEIVDGFSNGSTRMDRPPSGATPARRMRDATYQLVNFLGVRILLSRRPLNHPALVPLQPVSDARGAAPMYRYGIEDSPPFAYLARELRACDDATMLERLKAGRFGSGWAPCATPPFGTAGDDEKDESRGVAGYVKRTARSTISREYKVNILNPGYLVVRERYAPGWTSRVDGMPTETVVVDGIYRATPVPAGLHTVKEEYRPAGLRVGLGLNLLGLIIVFLGILFSRAAAQRRRALEDIIDDTSEGEDWFQ